VKRAKFLVLLAATPAAFLHFDGPMQEIHTYADGVIEQWVDGNLVLIHWPSTSRIREPWQSPIKIEKRSVILDGYGGWDYP